MATVKKKHFWVAFYAYGTLALSFAFVIVMAYWVNAPYKTIDFKNLPYKTNKTVYEQGENAYYEVTYCKYTDVMPTIHRQFVDGIIFEVPSSVAVIQKGCRTSRIPFTIPESLPAGKYHIKIQADYKMNPVRHILVENESNYFEIVSKK